MKKYFIITIVAILVLGALEGIALMNGIDGVLFTGIAAIISGLAGYNVHKARGQSNG